MIAAKSCLPGYTIHGPRKLNTIVIYSTGAHKLCFQFVIYIYQIPEVW